MTSTAKLKFVATVSPVREVVLHGGADLGFWRERLAAHGLVPVDHAGEARLLVGATEMRYMGLRAREFTIAVVARPASGDGAGEGYFLPQAFNSSRFFAWAERVWFTTPYRHAAVEVAAEPPARMRLLLAGQSAVEAAIGNAAAQPMRTGPESWRGPIYLPRAEGAPSSSDKVFYADLRGETTVYPWSPGDSFAVTPHPSAPVLEWLQDGRFTPREWSLRTAATHARSKTFRHDCPVAF